MISQILNVVSGMTLVTMKKQMIKTWGCFQESYILDIQGDNFISNDISKQYLKPSVTGTNLINKI